MDGFIQAWREADLFTMAILFWPVAFIGFVIVDTLARLIAAGLEWWLSRRVEIRKGVEYGDWAGEGQGPARW